MTGVEETEVLFSSVHRKQDEKRCREIRAEYRVENVVKVPDLKVNNKDFQKPLFLDTRGGYLRQQSFANVVFGKKNLEPNRFIIKAQEEDTEWLERSIVARLHTHREVESIREAFIAEGVVIYLNWLYNWFVDAKPWTPNLKVESSQVVWLNCYGIPVNLWDANTFFNIGKVWGETITLDEATSKKTSFSMGKIKISTNSFEVINHSLTLEHNGLIFPIRVVEAQVLVNNFMKAVCECHGFSFARVDYSLCSREKLTGNEEKIDLKDVDSDKAYLKEGSNLWELDKDLISYSNRGSGGAGNEALDGSEESVLGGESYGGAMIALVKDPLDVALLDLYEKANQEVQAKEAGYVREINLRLQEEEDDLPNDLFLFEMQVPKLNISSSYLTMKQIHKRMKVGFGGKREGQFSQGMKEF
ncbi:hypothetical protein Vadar_014651 [Vaccinium darrowii]|uniref:Uncharacterized protein n=1 Tax=Vaccinium darrowii TaxID=229202 RepID=A0ACB7ZB62_9ERIC|nr:hypothetical protein Vadar_014651 [Vaccinium darrowii]